MKMFLSWLGSFLFKSPELLKKKMPKTYAVGQKIADGIFNGDWGRCDGVISFGFRKLPI